MQNASETDRIKAKRAANAALFNPCSIRLFAVAHKLQQEHEHVDEVEIETQRAHHNLTAVGFRTIAFVIHFLDRLRVIGGQTSKNQDANDRDCKLQSGRAEEDVNDRGDDEAEKTHNQE